MHRAIVVIALALASGCAGMRGEDKRHRVTVKGLVTYHGDSARIHECGTPREIRLGPMDDGQAIRLRQDVEQHARRKAPVTAEFSGYLVRTGSKYVMERAAVLGVAAGRCTELPDPGNWDY